MSDIDRLRQEIDGADQELLQALAKRMKIAEALGRHKKANGMELLDEERFQELLADRIKRGEALDLPEDLVTGLYHKIHDAALDREAGA